ncbi:MAG: 16S rRNA (adenine(1518)-N(6)/adenine(1519)-N(6))-dimethyltransferase RsmA [Gammaproteobacteria bacterium]|nr:16S rRNA (adenine(1518)-N(6)/adenine(1519)-N(6))-dimethyltransferase RsmA [Gammaproteobacteria bacterium]
MPRARKRFGQHFLHDQNVIESILHAIDPQPGETIVEIGPGRGALTYPLLQRCKTLIAIELDRDLVPLLEKQASAFGNLEIINEDILEFDLLTIPHEAGLRLVGNLPYNISTPLMFHLLESANAIRDMHFMVQKEVASRIVASPGDSNYGRLSVMLQYQCDCQHLLDVAPGCFKPPPKVNSALIRLLPLSHPRHDVGDYATFSGIVQSAFGQRRKTISNSLKMTLDRETIIACGIDPGLRAENLALSDFAKLSRACTP